MNEIDEIVKGFSFKFARKLKNLRIKKGISQVNLSKQIGISRATYQLIESGESSIKMENYLKICLLLNVDFDYFLN